MRSLLEHRPEKDEVRTDSSAQYVPPVWSPDGAWIYFNRRNEVASAACSQVNPGNRSS